MVRSSLEFPFTELGEDQVKNGLLARLAIEVRLATSWFVLSQTKGQLRRLLCIINHCKLSPRTPAFLRRFQK